MKKVLSLVLVLVLACGLFAGCGDSDNKEKAIEAAEKFMDAYVALDADAIKELVVDEDDLPDGIKEFDFDAAMGELGGVEGFEEELKEILDIVIDKAKKKMSYEVEEVEENDGVFTVTVKAKVVDEVSEEFQEIVSEELSEEKMMEIAYGLIESGKITESTTEDELLSLILEEAFDLMKKVVSEIDFETREATYKIVVVEKDGKWLVDAKESDIED